MGNHLFTQLGVTKDGVEISVKSMGVGEFAICISTGSLDALAAPADMI